MKIRSFSEQNLIDAVKTSVSIRQVLNALNLRPAGGNYYTIKKYIKELGLDTSHFTGQCWNKGKRFPSKRPLSDYLSNKYPLASHKLKLRLFAEGVLNPACSSCESTQWFGKPIPLELHHIDGTHNNSLSNLEVLCPNCHALTPNYRGKGKKSCLNSKP